MIEIPAVTTNNGPVEQDVAALNKALNEPLAQRPAYDKQKRKEQLISKGFGNRLALTDGPELPIEQRSFWAYLYDALAAEYKGLVAPVRTFFLKPLSYLAKLSAAPDSLVLPEIVSSWIGFPVGRSSTPI